jgi:hypothetical protein
MGTVLIVFAVFAVLVGVAIVGLPAPRAPSAPRSLAAHFACPRTGAATDCTVIRDEENGTYLSVEKCEERGRWPAEMCQEECLKKLSAGEPLWQIRAG